LQPEAAFRMGFDESFHGRVGSCPIYRNSVRYCGSLYSCMQDVFPV
jgi:hypothetical protein